MIGGIFALSWRLEGKNGRRIMLLPSLLYLLVLPAVIGSVTGEMESSGYAWLDLIGPIIWVLMFRSHYWHPRKSGQVSEPLKSEAGVVRE